MSEAGGPRDDALVEVRDVDKLFRRGSEAEVWTERHTDAEPWLEQPHAG